MSENQESQSEEVRYTRRRALRRLSFESVAQAIAAGALILLVGGLAYITNQPFLFPALGPTAFLQAEYPFHRFSRFQDSSIGHLIGVLSGLLAVILLGVRNEPALQTGQSVIPTGRIAAAALTVIFVIVFQITVRISNPPSASVGLMFALGFFSTNLRDIVEVMTGALLLATFGVINRSVLRRRQRRLRDTRLNQTAEVNQQPQRQPPTSAGGDSSFVESRAEPSQERSRL